VIGVKNVGLIASRASIVGRADDSEEEHAEGACTMNGRKRWQLSLFDLLTLTAVAAFVLGAFRERDGRYVLALSMVTGAWLAVGWVRTRRWKRLQTLLIAHLAVLVVYPLLTSLGQSSWIVFSTEWLVPLALLFLAAQVATMLLPLREGGEPARPDQDSSAEPK
jgi:UDP-N-acetylmuramyl pentapeptide phosphotransferase/UDP-N-acetylglucosamine-1-phosphate transferase